MTKSLHEISTTLKDELELNDHPRLFLSNKVNLAYLLNGVPNLKRKSVSHGVIVQNTWYNCLEGNNIRVLGFGAFVAVANETVALRMTIDDVTWTASGVALTAGGNDCTGLAVNSLPIADETTHVFTQTAAGTTFVITPYAYDCFTGRRVKCEARKTTAGGAATLQTIIVYQQF